MINFNRHELQDKKLDDFRPKKPVEALHVDEFENDDEDEFSALSKFKIIAPVIIIAIICFFSYAWYTDKFAISRSDADIPIIKASREVLRIKPEDPGGMKIINQDKRVYDTISGEDDVQTVAKLLPKPEETISRSKIKNTEVTSKTEIIKAKPKPTNKQITQIEKPKLKKIIEKTSNTKVQEVTTADITDVHIEKKSKKPIAKKVPKGYRIQLGSYRSRGDAEISWKSLSSKFPKIIKNSSSYIEKADLGDKGTFYRLQIAGFKNESSARKTCQKLIQKKQECFFVGK